MCQSLVHTVKVSFSCDTVPYSGKVSRMKTNENYDNYDFAVKAFVDSLYLKCALMSNANKFMLE